ncbi:MAG: GNAT family N-acetyltransferase [Candidatus Bathyarchaeia archaeon]|nr:GNAT family N-acetyltransferase [Candidatus Bathyarchaeota archaeon]
MSSQVTVRRAEKSDLRALYEIEVECFQDGAFPLHYIAHFLEDPEFITLVTVVEGKVAGYVTARVENFEGKCMGHIYSIAVKPEYRRMGFGSCLLETVEEILEKMGAKVCYLEARRDNTAAIRFYLKHKYRVFEVLKDYYGAGRDGIRFMKFLLKG